MAANEILTRKIKAYRTFSTWTQEEIAEKLGISQATYNKKENGKIPFSLAEAKKIADLFGKNIEELFFEDAVFNTNTTV